MCACIGTHWAAKFEATVSPCIQQYKPLYVLFCDRISMNLYSQQQIEGLFNQFDLVPTECSEVTYAAIIAARKNSELHEALESELSREELKEAMCKFKKEQDEVKSQFDGLDLVPKTSCETDGGQAPFQNASTSVVTCMSNTASNTASARMCRCGSSTHQRTSHRDCPLNKKKN